MGQRKTFFSSCPTLFSLTHFHLRGSLGCTLQSGDRWPETELERPLDYSQSGKSQCIRFKWSSSFILITNSVSLEIHKWNPSNHELICHSSALRLLSFRHQIWTEHKNWQHSWAQKLVDSGSWKAACMDHTRGRELKHNEFSNQSISEEYQESNEFHKLISLKTVS